MISLRLAGGLGNQLFQLAAAAIMARKASCPIIIRTGALGKYQTPRELDLNKVIDLERLSATVCAEPHWSVRFRAPKVLPLALRNIAFVNDRNILDVVRCTGRFRHIYLDGYFIESVDQEYFVEAVSLINDALLVEPVTATTPHEICAVHVRGGDFLKLGWNLENLLEYYRAAAIAVRVLSPLVKFIVLTDDRAYAESLVKSVGIDVEFLNGALKDDFDLLRTAKYAILSNSTFSIWAGALRNPTITHLTYAPSEWRPGRLRRIRLAAETELPGY